MEKEAPWLMKEAERFSILSNIDWLQNEHLQMLKLEDMRNAIHSFSLILKDTIYS